jgi:phytoene dehydrogenase-like protein
MAARGAPIVVIGAGHNGLVCAAYLARAGRAVVVLERRAEVGGTLDTIELMPGVRAPGLVHSVGRLSPRVARELGLAGHGLRLVESDARLTAFAPGQPPLTLWRDAGRTAAELAPHSPSDADGYVAFDVQTRAFARLISRINAMPPPEVGRLRPSDMAGGLGVWLALRRLGRDAHELLRVLPLPIADYLADYLADPGLRAALAWRGVRYTSMAPSDVGSTQVFLTDVGATGGVAGEMTVALGGPGVLSAALATAARAAGAEVRSAAEVVRVIVEDGRVTGVELTGGERITASAVVSGADPKHTLLSLLDPELLGPTMGWEVANLRMRGGTSVVQLALAGLPQFDGLDEDGVRARLTGRILVGASLRTLDRAADAIKAGRITDDLVLEASLPSLLDPSLVEDGAAAEHVMSVLVHGTPYALHDGDWDTRREALADRVVAQLEEVAPNLRALVIARRVLTPHDLERDYGLTEGHPLHGEPALDQWFAWRPLLGLARYRLPLAGLYLCGSGAHPGGGVTGAPGRLAAREVLADARQ